ncbi:MATH and LRR domain-containing protein PFE0570w-like isoform X3 [Cylas formicarius]|uniref:MATH and LRR domain-containing protein PFE0570w-like isoform X3 n=1 Tax=Cylas formicarius TaxID=197179 RepID=UPI00295874B6|nr:MATH and LRR domain-containing protein PFE0570w-like isoform X3 [Cylas formicarius]
METSSSVTSTNSIGGMVVKRVSVPIGLEEVMEGLAKEVLLKKPKDLYRFAYEYFSSLLRLRRENKFEAKPVQTVQSAVRLENSHKPTAITRRQTRLFSRQLSVREMRLPGDWKSTDKETTKRQQANSSSPRRSETGIDAINRRIATREKRQSKAKSESSLHRNKKEKRQTDVGSNIPYKESQSSGTRTLSKERAQKSLNVLQKNEINHRSLHKKGVNGSVPGPKKVELGKVIQNRVYVPKNENNGMLGNKIEKNIEVDSTRAVKPTAPDLVGTLVSKQTLQDDINHPIEDDIDPGQPNIINENAILKIEPKSETVNKVKSPDEDNKDLVSGDEVITNEEIQNAQDGYVTNEEPNFAPSDSQQFDEKPPIADTCGEHLSGAGTDTTTNHEKSNKHEVIISLNNKQTEEETKQGISESINAPAIEVDIPLANKHVENEETDNRANIKEPKSSCEENNSDGNDEIKEREFATLNTNGATGTAKEQKLTTGHISNAEQIHLEIRNNNENVEFNDSGETNQRRSETIPPSSRQDVITNKQDAINLSSNDNVAIIENGKNAHEEDAEQPTTRTNRTPEGSKQSLSKILVGKGILVNNDPDSSKADEILSVKPLEDSAEIKLLKDTKKYEIAGADRNSILKDGEWDTKFHAGDIIRNSELAQLSLENSISNVDSSGTPNESSARQLPHGKCSTSDATDASEKMYSPVELTGSVDMHIIRENSDNNNNASDLKIREETNFDETEFAHNIDNNKTGSKSSSIVVSPHLEKNLLIKDNFINDHVKEVEPRDLKKSVLNSKEDPEIKVDKPDDIIQQEHSVKIPQQDIKVDTRVLVTSEHFDTNNHESIVQGDQNDENTIESNILQHTQAGTGVSASETMPKNNEKTENEGKENITSGTEQRKNHNADIVNLDDKGKHTISSFILSEQRNVFKGTNDQGIKTIQKASKDDGLKPGIHTIVVALQEDLLIAKRILSGIDLSNSHDLVVKSYNDLVEQHMSVDNAIVKEKEITKEYERRRNGHQLTFEDAVSIIQKSWKGFLMRKQVQNSALVIAKNASVIKIQALWRGHRARNYAKKLKQDYREGKIAFKGVILLQAQVRGFLERRRFEKLKKNGQHNSATLSNTEEKAKTCLDSKKTHSVTSENNYGSLEKSQASRDSNGLIEVEIKDLDSTLNKDKESSEKLPDVSDSLVKQVVAENVKVKTQEVKRHESDADIFQKNDTVAHDRDLHNYDVNFTGTNMKENNVTSENDFKKTLKTKEEDLEATKNSRIEDRIENISEHAQLYESSDLNEANLDEIEKRVNEANSSFDTGNLILHTEKKQVLQNESAAREVQNSTQTPAESEDPHQNIKLITGKNSDTVITDIAPKEEILTHSESSTENGLDKICQHSNNIGLECSEVDLSQTHNIKENNNAETIGDEAMEGILVTDKTRSQDNNIDSNTEHTLYKQDSSVDHDNEKSNKIVLEDKGLTKLSHNASKTKEAEDVIVENKIKSLYRQVSKTNIDNNKNNNSNVFSNPEGLSEVLDGKLNIENETKERKVPSVDKSINKIKNLNQQESNILSIHERLNEFSQETSEVKNETAEEAFQKISETKDNQESKNKKVLSKTEELSQINQDTPDIKKELAKNEYKALYATVKSNSSEQENVVQAKDALADNGVDIGKTYAYEKSGLNIDKINPPEEQKSNIKAIIRNECATNSNIEGLIQRTVETDEKVITIDNNKTNNIPTINDDEKINHEPTNSCGAAPERRRKSVDNILDIVNDDNVINKDQKVEEGQDSSEEINAASKCEYESNLDEKQGSSGNISGVEDVMSTSLKFLKQSDALDEHVGLIDQVQNQILDQISGKISQTGDKFDIEELRKELQEAASLYKSDQLSHLDNDDQYKLVQYITSFNKELDSKYDNVSKRSPLRNLPDIEEEEVEPKKGSALENHGTNAVFKSNSLDCDKVQLPAKVIRKIKVQSNYELDGNDKSTGVSVSSETQSRSQKFEDGSVSIQRASREEYIGEGLSVESGNQTAIAESPADDAAVTSPRNGRESATTQASNEARPATPIENGLLQSYPPNMGDKQDHGGEGGNTVRNGEIGGDNDVEVEAATKIQAGFRGFQVRKQLKQKNETAEKQVQRKSLKKKDSLKSNSKPDSNLEEKSAVKIQAGVRGFLVRRRQKKVNSSPSA